MTDKLTCPRCNGTNVVVQAVGITRTKKKGFLYRLFIGRWLEPTLRLLTFGLMLIVKLFRSRKVETIVESYGICQTCGNSWKIQS